MTQSREETLASLRNSSLHPIFQRIWEGSGPEALRVHWEAPKEYFRISNRAEVLCPRLERCLPLLECNLERLIALDGISGEFIEYYYGDNECRIVAQCYQQLVSYLFVEFVYAGLLDVAEELTDDLGYKYLDLLRNFAESDDDLTAEEAKRSFVESIPCPATL